MQSAGLAREPGKFFRHRDAVDAALSDHQKADRMDRCNGAGREDRALHALLPAIVHEGGEILEVGERRLIDRGLGADRQRRARLRDDDADLAGRDLHHRVARHRKDRPELEPQPGAEQLGLISGFTAKCHRAAAVEVAQAEALANEADLGRADGPERSP
jgi:hypothetical protein